VKLPWIQWKNLSCRIDAFTTVAYFVFFNDFSEDIFPPIQGLKLPDEIHPLGVLLRDVDEADSLSMLQKGVDKYVTYRSQSLKEKSGKVGHIYSLFSELKNLPHFIWNCSLTFMCNHSNSPIIRNFDSEPIFTISTASLNQSDGFCSSTRRYTLGSYLNELKIISK